MRFLTVVILFACALGSFPLDAAAERQVPPHAWSRSMGSSGADAGVDIAVDPSGNTVVFGCFRGTVDFSGSGQSPLVSAGHRDLCVAQFDPAGHHVWSRRFGSAEDEWPRALAVDDDGAVYLTGTFVNAIDFGGGGLIHAGQDDVYLVKLDASGNHVWSHRFGDSDRDLVCDLSIDRDGFHVYLTGTFAGAIDFGGGTLNSAGGLDLYLAKIKTTTGGHVWSRAFGGAGNDAGRGVAVDGYDDVLLTGQFEDAVDFGGGPLVSMGDRDVCLVKLDGNGGHVWSRSYGGGEDDLPSAIAVDATNRVVITGSFRSTADFGGGPLASQGEEDIFLARYDLAGLHIWSKAFGGAGEDVANGVAINPDKEIHITGYCGDAVSFGGYPLWNSGEVDIFLAKLTNTGVHMWSHTYGNFAADHGEAVTVDDAGNVFVTGDFEFAVDMGGTWLYSEGSSVDLFVASFTPNGVRRWSGQYGGLGFDRAAAVASDPDGNVVVTGQYCGSVDLGGGVFTSAGREDIFVAKYDPAGDHLWSRAFGDSTSYDAGTGVAVDADGHVYVTGYFRGSVDFGGGVLTSAGLSDIFLAKYDEGGNHVWSRRFGNTASQMGFAVTVGPGGEVAITGHTAGPVDFGGGPLGYADDDDIYVAVFDDAGAHRWSRSFGGVLGDYSYCIAMDVDGNTIIGGASYNTIDLGGGPILNRGGLDGCIASYDPSGVHNWSRGFGSAGSEAVRSVAADLAGSVVMTGEFEGTVDFGGGGLVCAGDYDAVLAKYTISGAHLWSQRFGDAIRDLGQCVDVDDAGDILLAGEFQGLIDLGGGPLVTESVRDIFLGKFDGSGHHVWSERLGDVGWDDIGGAVFVDSETILLAGHYMVSTDVGGGTLTSTGGWDIVLAKLGGSPAGTDDEGAGSAARWTAGSVRPNPSRGMISLHFTRPTAGHTSVGIYDVAGRLVRALLERELGPGAHDVVWDGRDDSGRRVAAGTYVLRIDAGETVVARRLVRLE